jgi:hypothetical protein
MAPLLFQATALREMRARFRAGVYVIFHFPLVHMSRSKS